MQTRTGGYSIGFRMRGWTSNVTFAEALAWTKANGLGGVDIGSNADAVGQQVLDAGLWIGTADLRSGRQLLSPNAATRAAAVAAYRPYVVRELAAGMPLRALLRPLMGLYQGQPHARAWRRALTVFDAAAGAGALDDALACVDKDLQLK